MNRLRALVDVAGGMVEAMTAENRLAGAVVTHLAEYFTGGVSVWLQPAGGGPLLVASAGHPPALLGRLTGLIQGASGVPHPALAAGQPILMCRGIDFDCHVDGGLCLVPMSANGRLVGVVAATTAPDTPPVGEDVVEFATTLADMAAVTLVNARVLADATAVTEDLRSQIEVLDDISDALIGLDSERRIINWNTGAERVYGYARADALGCDMFSLLATQFVTSDGQPAAAADVFDVAVEAGGWRGEVRERRADGVPLTVLSSLNITVDDDRTPRGFVLVNRDITDQRREEHRALHDALTGLPNRRMLTNRLYDAFARSCRNGTALAVLFVDLLEFRLVNDVYGREAGDEVLRSTGARLVATLRGSDVVARMQGDGFVVVLENAGNAANVRMVADRIARAVVEPIQAGPDVIKVAPTVGAILATGTESLEASPDRLIELANDARHMAKAAGATFALEYLAPAAV